MTSWKIGDVLENIGKVATIHRRSGDIEQVYIKNILLDPRTQRTLEIVYVKDKGAAKEINHLIVGHDTLIEPTGEEPILRPVDSHLDINRLAGDIG